MKRSWKAIAALAVPLSLGYLATATIFNEAFHIRRVSAEAKVNQSHRFGPVFSFWDIPSFFVLGDYISPIDYGDVVIDLSSEPVSIERLVNLRVSTLHITDSEIIDFRHLLSGDENPYIVLVGPIFINATEEEMRQLNRSRRVNEITGYVEYCFGNV